MRDHPSHWPPIPASESWRSDHRCDNCFMEHWTVAFSSRHGKKLCPDCLVLFNAANPRRLV